MKSKYFQIHELVPKYIFDKYGEDSWRFINPRLIMSIDKLKERFPKGTMTINNYFWGGGRNWSGLRTQRSPYYREMSMHSLGGAIDAIFSDYETDDVIDDIIDNRDLYPYINGIELGVSWLHVDVRNTDQLITFTA